MRRIDLTFSALKVPLDFVALLGAGLTAYALRYSQAFVEIRPILQQVPFAQYIVTAALFSTIGMILFAMAGLYSIQPRKTTNELGRILLSCTAGIMLVIAVVFFRREVATSRFLILALWGFAVLYTWLGRIILRIIRHLLLQRKIGHQCIAIIGESKAAQDLADYYGRRPHLGYTVIKMIPTWDEVAHNDIERLVKERRIHGLLLADPNATKAQARDLVAFAENQHLTFRYLADLFAATFTSVEVSTTGGIPVIEVKRTPLDGWGRILKRLFDLVVSGLLLIILSPIMLVTAIAVVLDSKGGVFFSKLPDGKPVERIGEGGRPFHYFKFRSMQKDQHFKRYAELAHLNTREDGPLVKLKDDPRVTRVGRFIRKWSIDELPELILVFLGRMSLVGPRPHYTEEVAKYKPPQRRVLAIKPGITGMTQISGRASLDFEDEVKLDTWYIENWSLWLDLYILLKTPRAVVSHRGVEEGS